MSTTTQQNGTHRVPGPDLFPEQERQQKRKDVQMTVFVQFDGFPVELTFTGTVDQLPAVAKRLRDIGAQPAHTAPVSAQNGSGAAQLPVGVSKPRVVEFDGDGAPICPVHGTVMRESTNYSGSWYCSRKAADGEPANSKGYCACSYQERQ